MFFIPLEGYKNFNIFSADNQNINMFLKNIYVAVRGIFN